MKNRKKLKQALAFLFILTAFLATSCKSDDNGVAEIIFVNLPSSTLGAYTGDLTYTSGTNVVATEDGTATLSSSGQTYAISFSDGVPSLTGLRFILSDGEYISVTDDGFTTTGVAVNGSSLSVGDDSNGSLAFDGNK